MKTLNNKSLILIWIPGLFMILSMLLADDHSESARGYLSAFAFIGGFHCLIPVSFFVGFLSQNNKTTLIAGAVMFVFTFGLYYLRMYEYVICMFKGSLISTEYYYLIILPLKYFLISLILFFLGLSIRIFINHNKNLPE